MKVQFILVWIVFGLANLIFASEYTEEELKEDFQECTNHRVDYEIIKSIVQVESDFNPFSIGINSKNFSLEAQPERLDIAINTAKQLIEAGVNVDLGLGQINVKNFDWLGLNAESVFNTCLNLNAIETVYLECFSRTEGKINERISQALSCYNTGDFKSGVINGYVAKVLGKPKEIIVQNNSIEIQNGYLGDAFLIYIKNDAFN